MDRFFGDYHEKIHENWKILDQTQQLEWIKSASFERPVGIFKHSVRCGTSAMVKYDLESNWIFSAEELEFYYLDLISFRPVSNLVAETFGVYHHSPQIILIKNGAAFFHTSHHMIRIERIQDALRNFAA